MTSLATRYLGLDLESPLVPGASPLADLASLETLNLKQNAITDQGLEKLQKLTGLKSLQLGLTQTSDAGVKQFEAAVPKCKVAR